MGNRSPEALKRHYRDYQGTPEQLKKQAMRHKARADAIKAGKIKKGDPRDIHHVRPVKNGGSNSPSNTKAVSKSANRGYNRDSRNRPV